MKKRILLLIIIACLLLITTAQASQDRSLPTYIVHAGVISGGEYSLTGLSWQVSGATQSQRYILASPATPASSENGCCCTYLPCLRR